MWLKGTIRVNENARQRRRQAAGGRLLYEEAKSFLPSDAMSATIPTQQTEAIVAVFDLSGFSSFCCQADPADIPNFLNAFLEWLFNKIEGDMASDGVNTPPLWKEPPFFAKFLGDGIMLLWDTGNMVDRQVANLMAVLLDTCDTYRYEFCIGVSEHIKNPPRTLRCSIARGGVFPVNNGRDYVGHCINVAAHLQEHKRFSFCIAGKGFDIAGFMEDSLASQLLSLPLPIKGIGTNMVWVLRREAGPLTTLP